MSNRDGYLLEQTLAGLFNRAGFNVEVDKWINGYEVDVFATKGTYKVAVECKHYEYSQTTIRNILHQWESKRRFINVDKIVVAFYGKSVQPTREDYDLAKSLRIGLISNEEIESLMFKSDKELINKLDNLVEFPSEIQVTIKKWKWIGIGVGLLVLGFLVWKFYETIKWMVIIIGIVVVLEMFRRNNPVKRRRRK